ncbi:MAG: glycoside hydrolase family 25 protein [Oscillospiraceae bacterium]|nr:glycoside hydrolase family 25 protein [Oscillospiraceae bacterium]
MVLTKRKLLYIAIAALSALLLVLLCICLLPKGKPQPGQAPTEATQPTLETNPLNPQAFTYINGFLTCVSAESQLGIDVSSHQGEINWEQVKKAGVEFVMLRAGYRGLDQGGLYEDEYAQRNYAGAKAAGLKVGAYFFSQATTPEEALKEAEFALVITKDWQLDMPLVYDWEYSGEENRVAAMTAPQVTECALLFCEKIKDAGITPMVYFNPDIGRNFLNLEALQDYPFWLAMYDRDFTYEYKVDMWQYTCEGSVPGIAGNVDINLYFP